MQAIPTPLLLLNQGHPTTAITFQEKNTEPEKQRQRTTFDIGNVDAYSYLDALLCLIIVCFVEFTWL